MRFSDEPTVFKDLAAMASRSETDPTNWVELARRVATAPEEEAAAIWEELCPYVDHLAEAVARSFAHQPKIQQIIREDGPSHVWEKLRAGAFQPEHGNFFSSWCWRVLTNQGRTAQRRHRRQPVQSLSDGSDEPLIDQQFRPSTPDPTVLAYLKEHAPRRRELFHRERLIRSTLDRLAWSPPRQETVDYYAAFLLWQRLGCAGRLGDLWLDDAEAPPFAGITPAIWAERLVPWKHGELFREIRPGWPSLGDLWKHLRPALNRPPFNVTTQDVVRAIDECSAGQVVVTVPALEKQRSRSRAQARERLAQMDPAAWDTYFAQFH